MKKLKKFFKKCKHIYFNIRFPFLSYKPQYANNFIWKRITNAEKKYMCISSINVCTEQYIEDIKSGAHLEKLKKENPYMNKNTTINVSKSIYDYYGSNIELCYDNNTLDIIVNGKHNTYNVTDLITPAYKSKDPLDNISISDITDVYIEEKIEKFNTIVNNNIRKFIFILFVTDKIKDSKTDYIRRFEIILNKSQKYIIKFYNILNNIINIKNIGSYWYNIPYGWRKAFGLQMCKEIKHSLIYTYIREENISKTNIFKYIKAYLKGIKLLYTISFSQVKEKYGTLRIYLNSSTDDVYEIVDKYEDLSYNTCINCGKPAEYISQGWISPYCEDCIPDKNRAVKKEKISTYKKAINEWKDKT